MRATPARDDRRLYLSVECVPHPILMFQYQCIYMHALFSLSLHFQAQDGTYLPKKDLQTGLARLRPSHPPSSDGLQTFIASALVGRTSSLISPENLSGLLERRL